MFWRSKNTEKKLAEINSLLINSFDNVKRDTGLIFQWLEYLYNENLKKESVINDLNLQLKNMPATKGQVKEIIDKHYSYEIVFERIKELHKITDEIKLRQDHYGADSERISRIDARLDGIDLKQKPLLTEMENLSLKINNHEQKSPKTSIREKIIRKITKNQKDYVKNLILSLIKKYGRISALQLREIVIEEQGLCSKSSFYRLLAELEENEKLVAVQEGKEKYYLSKTLNFSSKM